MSFYSRDKIEELKAITRKLMVAGDDITSRQVASALHIDHKTANKLMNKIRVENTENINRNVIAKELGKAEMHFKLVIQNHWETINNKERERMEYFDKNPKKDEKGNYIPFRIEHGAYIVPIASKIQAAKGIVDTFEKLFKMKFDAGVFARKLGELELNMPIGDLVKKVVELTGENEFSWQNNKGLNKFKADVENKPADKIAEPIATTDGAGKDGWSASEVKK